MKEPLGARWTRRFTGAIGGRLSYANVMATVAVFIALGGSAWAVAANSIGSKELKRNAVGKKHVKKNAVGTKELRANAVGSAIIRDNAVRPPKIPDGSLTGAKILESSLGQVPSAATAANAALLDGLDSTAFQRARTRVFQVNRDEVRDFVTGSTLAQLTVPEGTYLALAKLSIIHPGAGNDATTTCDLSVPGANDDSQMSRMGGGGTVADQLGFPLATTFTGSGNVSLRCTNFSGANDAFNIKLIALRVD
jgi:hypothetical protein